ncbi:MAG: hypothetical protein M1832_005482 [Thelocarpon impressellum]|nr:MAG: hypothetical protein M1832_005482 [Thelocarpon impressellum]
MARSQMDQRTAAAAEEARPEPHLAPTPFHPAIVATPVPEKGDNVYAVDLKRDWCVGQVPEGGYLAAILTGATTLHFRLRHASHDQPDTITTHIEYITRSVIGHAEVWVHVIKLGRQFSTARVQLVQYTNSEARVAIEAFITQGNLAREAASDGLTLPTRPAIPKHEIPVLATCVERRDPPPYDDFRPAVSKLRYFLPADTDSNWQAPRLGPSVRESWVTWADGVSDTGFDVGSLAFLADTFRPIPEAYGIVGNWFPTLNMGFEVKKAPENAAEGWKWLYMRTEMRAIRHGRFDLDVIITDETGDLVALSRHTALIVDAGRNWKAKDGTAAKL